MTYPLPPYIVPIKLSLYNPTSVQLDVLEIVIERGEEEKVMKLGRGNPLNYFIMYTIVFEQSGSFLVPT